MTLAGKLKHLTRLHNLKAVAQAAEISEFALRAAIHGKRKTRRATIAAIARVLNVDSGWLGDDTRNWPPAWSPGALELPENVQNNIAGESRQKQLSAS